MVRNTAQSRHLQSRTGRSESPSPTPEGHAEVTRTITRGHTLQKQAAVARPAEQIPPIYRTFAARGRAVMGMFREAVDAESQHDYDTAAALWRQLSSEINTLRTEASRFKKATDSARLQVKSLSKEESRSRIASLVRKVFQLKKIFSPQHYSGTLTKVF